MEFTGEAYQSPGDGGEVCVYVDLSSYEQEIIWALEEMKENEEDFDDDCESFLRDISSSLVSKIEDAIQEEAESTYEDYSSDFGTDDEDYEIEIHSFVCWPSIRSIAEDLGFEIED